jgi:hypothetical protein
MTKPEILLEIISAIGALGSIFWLYIDPGPEPLVASIGTLGIILGIAARAQIKLSKISAVQNNSERLKSVSRLS